MTRYTILDFVLFCSSVLVPELLIETAGLLASKEGFKEGGSLANLVGVAEELGVVDVSTNLRASNSQSTR